MWPKNRLARTILKFLSITFLVVGLAFGLFIWLVKLPTPEVNSTKTPQSYKRIKLGPDSYKVDNCWLRKNKNGIWEMYLEGAPYERGLIYGVLAKELMEKQEVHFVAQIKEIIPNSFFLQVLKGFVAWFNKDIYKYIQDENLQEIYGVSQSFSDQFNYIGPKYYRILNYHAAHDIGHALTDLNMVGCTSFAVNNSLSKDSTLLIGRNFDFYMGDAFAEDKLIVFINPDKGYKFASYAWAGLTGVVSGINEKGITVTLNASKSDIPYGAKEPISLLAREILQYAATIDEANAIAKKRDTFVSESLLIGSAQDNKAVIIEKSPKKMDVYSSGKDYLVCANHYQGSAFIKDSVNIKNLDETDSKARFERMNQLMTRNYPMDVNKAAEILRDKKGLNDTFIGYGNSRSLNQLIAHHGVIFKPAERKVWVSTPPYQLGKFICYDLNDVFSHKETFHAIDSLAIKADTFLLSGDYKKFEAFKATKQKIHKYVMLGIPYKLTPADEFAMVTNNPESYVTYLTLGDYYEKQKNYDKAIGYYQESLQHVVASKSEIKTIKAKIEACKKEKS
ncbi:Acyl-coenzyme A:6-aminopenicillanic acid acyl-transferase [Dyadobacter koreensis]|uniref:Acyl-coenzyme A:6-aminopenicillanic acid acyl-transferase n=1 Tax=Dyadobacter koreensis TaxID=408657 RepID=A0A1H6SZ09_9BACT|nr:C45 family autoproteolytic acyltransferase/hydolase [Dyadobacter koreensis]SEI73093.1 Acyl-coenzyme A:6-aminopenicillanic acid acyl-transferase [Dyadobacter koreensis]